MSGDESSDILWHKANNNLPPHQLPNTQPHQLPDNLPSNQLPKQQLTTPQTTKQFTISPTTHQVNTQLTILSPPKTQH